MVRSEIKLPCLLGNLKPSVESYQNLHHGESRQHRFWQKVSGLRKLSHTQHSFTKFTTPCPRFVGDKCEGRAPGTAARPSQHDLQREPSNGQTQRKFRVGGERQSRTGLNRWVRQATGSAFRQTVQDLLLCRTPLHRPHFKCLSTAKQFPPFQAERRAISTMQWLFPQS